MTKLLDKGLSYLEQTDPFLFRMLTYHRTHENKKISFKGRKYLIDIYLDKSPEMAVVKSTQCGVSEWLIGYSINESMIGNNVLYVLPTEIIRTRFVSARFNKSIEFSKGYISEKIFNSINLKSFGTGVINFIGSNAVSGFAEFVAKTIIKDEVDYCNQQNLAMAVERQSAQIGKKNINVGNPTIEDFGIDYEYNRSDKKRWIITCECGHRFNPDFFKNVVIQTDKGWMLRDKKWERGIKRDIYPICEKCLKPFDRFVDGEWIKENNYSDISGYQISKMFSTQVKIKELVERFSEGLRKPHILQRFYNGDLGQAFTAEGSKISKQMLDDLIGNYSTKDKINMNFGIIGIDVGSVLNIIIADLLPNLMLKVVYIGEIKPSIKELTKLFVRYNIKIGVIDALPEQHFVNKIKGIHKNFFSCYYSESKKAPVDDVRNVTIGRTTSLDELQEAIIMKTILLPKDVEIIPDFYDQMQASTRIYEEKADEKGVYVWKHSKPDHYHHALNYCLLARKLIVASRR